MKPFLPESPQPSDSSASPSSTQGVEGTSSAATVKENAVAQPVWALGTNFRVDVFISTSPEPSDLFGKKKEDGHTLAHVTWEDINWRNRSVDETWSGDLHVPAVSKSFHSTPPFFCN